MDGLCALPTLNSSLVYKQQLVAVQSLLSFDISGFPLTYCLADQYHQAEYVFEKTLCTCPAPFHSPPTSSLAPTCFFIAWSTHHRPTSFSLKASHFVIEESFCWLRITHSSTTQERLGHLCGIRKELQPICLSQLIIDQLVADQEVLQGTEWP